MNLAAHPLDTWLLYLGALLVAASALLAWRLAAASPLRTRPGMSLDDAALAVLALGIALRWARIGHGPFLSLFEVLASSLVSLGLAWRLAALRLPLLREGAPLAFSLLAMMAAWLLVASTDDTLLPPTYEMPILWVHVALGKIFLGCAFVASGLAGVLLARRTTRGARWFQRMPADAALDRLAWRFMLAALVFESLMLVAGAVWAQDAWGRFWAWDPLETWAFLTWIALSAAVHARIAWRIGPHAGAVMIVGVFALAFLTFFGVPFVSVAPHKGAV
ncbi:MAG TPA: cytochrome c biogenesis protein CcsA [Ktedonobacterales bacterium]|nr:cytochrome c biogenesis protein CcsA [Ktedonobacterales bacterium]